MSLFRSIGGGKWVRWGLNWLDWYEGGGAVVDTELSSGPFIIGQAPLSAPDVGQPDPS